MREWLRRTFSEDETWPSSRRQFFALALGFGLGMAVAFSYQKKTAESLDLTKTVIWATASALTVGKFAEAK
jgi:hypothetical protein